VSPILLGLAFIVVGVAAWLLGRRAASSRTVRLPRDYYEGLDHLINDRFDRATEVFARMAQVDGDAAEIQFALGSLFRRRGEMDRAITIHARMREQGDPSLREKATLALALDYHAAGLMDRAERLFEELSASREHRSVALDHLVRIHEQQGDWANALRVFEELPAAVRQERRRVAAHYLCELAELAFLQGDVERARVLLRQARSREERFARADVLAARMTESAGDAAEAMRQYLDALERTPELALEIVPRLLRLADASADAALVADVAARLRTSARLSPRQLAWLIVSALPDADSATARPLLEALLAEAQQPGDVQAFGAVLARMGDVGGRYQCDDCGMHSVGWYWRCPRCRSWDALRPALFKWAERADEAARSA